MIHVVTYSSTISDIVNDNLVIFSLETVRFYFVPFHIGVTLENISYLL